MENAVRETEGAETDLQGRVPTFERAARVTIINYIVVMIMVCVVFIFQLSL